MLTFLVHNPERFSSDSLIWPGIICVIKFLTAIGAQAICILNFFYLKDALSTIKFYAIISIIAIIDTKMLAMISNIKTEGSIEENPLEFNNSSISVI
jgi:formate-dependent nitrite reductase membrane component NrfD